MSTQDFGRDETFPPCSPDLNLIENVWGLMAQGLARRNVETPEQLDVAIRQEWESISPTTLNRMYLLYRKRLQAVVDARGCNTKY
jgi:transposase